MEALVREAVCDADLHPDEIPSIDLYLDQITSLMAGKLEDGSPRFSDRVLTKTMINNYSKDGLISPVKGKKYSKDQILQMLIVYSLKNTLSIGEIKRILQSVYALPDFDADFLESVYTRFLTIKQTEREKAVQIMHGFLKVCELDPKNEADFFTMLLGLSALSSYIKNMVQILLEARYPDTNVEKAREEQVKKEEAKRQKEEKKEEKKAEKAAKKEGQTAEQTEKGTNEA